MATTNIPELSSCRPSIYFRHYQNTAGPKPTPHQLTAQKFTNSAFWAKVPIWILEARWSENSRLAHASVRCMEDPHVTELTLVAETGEVFVDAGQLEVVGEFLAVVGGRGDEVLGPVLEVVEMARNYLEWCGRCAGGSRRCDRMEEGWPVGGYGYDDEERVKEWVRWMHARRHLVKT